MASKEKELSGLTQTSDPPRSRLAALTMRLIYPFLRGKAPEPRPATGFYTDTTICIGCKACEVACKEWNHVPEDGLALTGMSYDNSVGLGADTWRHVAFIEQQRPVSVPDGAAGVDAGSHRHRRTTARGPGSSETG